MRFVPLVVSALLLACTLPAGAVKPVCHVIPDGRGDARWVLPLPAAPTDDIVDADVASDGRTLTAVIRMADVSAMDTAWPLGRRWALQLRVGLAPRRWFLAAQTDPTGTRFSYGYDDPGLVAATGDDDVEVELGRARGVLDSDRNEVRLSAPVAGLRGAGIRRGTKLVALHVSVERWVGQTLLPPPAVGPVHVRTQGEGMVFDTADGDHYVVGTPSCVRVGA